MRTGDGGRNTNEATDWSTVNCFRLALHEQSLISLFTKDSAAVGCSGLVLGRAFLSDGEFPDDVAFWREEGRDDVTRSSGVTSEETTPAVELSDSGAGKGASSIDLTALAKDPSLFVLSTRDCRRSRTFDSATKNI